MSAPAYHGTVTQPPAKAAETLHLCNNYRQLLMAVADIARSGKPAVVLYLEDELPLSPQIRQKLALACPEAEFLYTTDAAQMAEFARLPEWLPALVRRNLTLKPGRRGLVRVAGWQPPILQGRRFATGYVYHAGYFTSKPVAGLCDRIILRESGLNMYVHHPVSGLKSIIRLFSGLPPRDQVWGEESWVDAIEVVRPEDLPQRVRRKASVMTIGEIMDALPAERAHSIAGAFIDSLPDATADERTALLLTQPLDSINICSREKMFEIYSDLVRCLTNAGYKVFLKNHPRDTPYSLPDTTTISAHFPIEAWAYLDRRPFNVAVALHSSALDGMDPRISSKTVQLLSKEQFNPKGFPEWGLLLSDELHKHFSPPTSQVCTDTDIAVAPSAS